MFRRIVLAWDEEHPPHAALRVARDLARAYEAELVAASLHAGRHGTAAGQPPPRDVAATAIAGPDPLQALLWYAHEHGFDLLVVGSRADDRYGRVFTRKTVEWLLDRAALPVLAVSEAGDAAP
jgi:nucleotide-binding universal stress UspA family protein